MRVRSDPGSERRVLHHHLSGHPAEQPAAGEYQDGESLDEPQDDLAPGDDERDGEDAALSGEVFAELLPCLIEESMATEGWRAAEEFVDAR